MAPDQTTVVLTGASAGIGCTIGGGLVEAVEFAVFDESVVVLFEVFESFELLELFLVLRAQGGRSVRRSRAGHAPSIQRRRMACHTSPDM